MIPSDAGFFVMAALAAILYARKRRERLKSELRFNRNLKLAIAWLKYVEHGEVPEAELLWFKRASHLDEMAALTIGLSLIERAAATGDVPPQTLFCQN